MQTRHLSLGLLAMLGVSLLTSGAYAQLTPEQQKLLAKRAAEADAYRKIAEAVKGLHINATTSVADFVTQSDQIRAGVDAFIRGVKLGQPRWFEDGMCEVEAEVTIAEIVTTLKELHTRHYKGDRVKALDFQQMTQEVKKTKVHVVGQGAPREDLPPNLPEGVAQQIGAPPVPPRPAIPKIWQGIPVKERLKAKRAAELDGKRKLLERIIGLWIDVRTQVRDFVTERDVINTIAEGRLTGARAVGEYYHDNELIVEVTVEVPVEWVVEIVKEISMRSWQGDRLKAFDFEQIIRKQYKDNFQAVGMGTVGIQYVKQVATVQVPEWPQVIRATGQGTDPEIKTAQGKLKAGRAAELDAKRKLLEQVWGLQIRANTVVRDYVTERDEIRSQVEGVLQGAVVESTRLNDDGTVEVTVAIPSAQVWTVIYRQMQIEARPR